MPLAALIPAAVALGGGLIKGGTKTGKNTTQTQSFGQTTAYDPTKFQYGGHAGGAAEAAGRYATLGSDAQGRTATQADFSGSQPNYAEAAAHGANANAVRGGQDNVAGMMMARATGAVPSIAQMQADRQMGQATAAQGAQAASARGAAGVALAQQGAANNIANAHGAISNQAQINAANERLQAENAAFDAYSGMRRDDFTAGDASSRRAEFGADLATRQETINAGLRDGQFGRNDAFQLGMTGHERGVQTEALRGGISNQQVLSGSIDRQQGERARQGSDNAKWENDNFDGTAKAISSGAGGGASIPGKARGGPVGVGTPYLVGEEGPEIIVPRDDGTVIPAGPTAALLKGGARPRAKGGPMTGVRMLSPQKAGAITVAGQPKAPTLSKGGKGKGATKPVATMPMPAATRKPTPEDYAAPDIEPSFSQWNGGSTFSTSREDQRTEQMRASHGGTRGRTPDDDRGTIGQEVLAKPYDPTPAPKAASPADQAAFEAKLTGQSAPMSREESNAAEAEKIRAGFAEGKQTDEATAQWKRINGPQTKWDELVGNGEADAGVRDSKQSVPMWQQALLAATGNARAAGGPIDGFMSGVKRYFSGAPPSAPASTTTSVPPKTEEPPMSRNERAWIQKAFSDGMNRGQSVNDLDEVPAEPDYLARDDGGRIRKAFEDGMSHGQSTDEVPALPDYLTAKESDHPNAERAMQSFKRHDAGKEAEKVALREQAHQELTDATTGRAGIPTALKGLVDAERAKGINTDYHQPVGDDDYSYSTGDLDRHTGRRLSPEQVKARQAEAIGDAVRVATNPARAIPIAAHEFGKDAAFGTRKAAEALGIPQWLKDTFSPEAPSPRAPRTPSGVPGRVTSSGYQLRQPELFTESQFTTLAPGAGRRPDKYDDEDKTTGETSTPVADQRGVEPEFRSRHKVALKKGGKK